MKPIHPRRRQLGAVLAVSVAAVVLAACSSGGSSGANAGGSVSGLPASIPVTYVADMTGLAGPVGQADLKGMQAAMQAAQDSGLIGSSRIDLKVVDTGSDTQKSNTLTQQAVASDSIAMFSPALSGEGLPAAQLAQRGELPFLAVQSNAPGITDIGEYIYAGTPAPAAYVPLTDKYVMEKFAPKSVGFLYGSDSPSLVLGWDTFKQDLGAKGVQIGESVGLTAKTTDFTSAASKVAASTPDAVGIILVASQNATAVSALRQAGFKGQIFAYNGAAGGYLKAAGPDGAGIPYSVSFGPGMSFDSSKKFEALYQKMNNGEAPSVFAAEGYVAMDLLLHALAASQDASRQGVLDGLQKVAASDGFDSSVGRAALTGDNKRALQSPGALLLWDGTKENLIDTGAAPQ